MSYLLRRLLHGMFVLWAMSALVFLALYAIGNPVDLLADPQADAADKARVLQSLGLDRPLWAQYGRFLLLAVQGDFGRSFVHGSPAIPLILSRLPATLELATTALVIALAVGLPLGLIAGLRPSSRLGRLFSALAFAGFTLPTFWVGLMLILVFAVTLGWLPAGGREGAVALSGIEWAFLSLEGWRYLILPALTLALFKSALVIRLTAQATRDTLTQPFIRTARAKGLGEAAVVRRHVLPNILIPLITVLGMEFGGLVAFAVVTESIFGWPGMGKLLIEAINALDRPVVVAYLMITTTLFVGLSLLIDLTYTLIDPRVRLGGETVDA